MFTSRSSRLRYSISRGAKIGLVVIIIILIAAGSYAELVFKPTRSTSTSSSATSSSETSSSKTSSSSSFSGLCCPANSSMLVDESPSSTYDSLDPDVGFFTVDSYFANVFQGLVTFNPTNLTSVVPALASSWNVSGNFENYTFTMRPNTWFSNHDPVNAYVAWFSFVRVLYINAPTTVGYTNYVSLTFNSSLIGSDGNIWPSGLKAALVSVGVPNNENALTSALNQMLGNFNPSNTTQVKIMSYPGQTYVALSNSTFQVNLIQPYKLFLLDLPPQWGAIVDPKFIDVNGGVANNTQPSYFTHNGMVGTGPYMYKVNAPAANNLVVLNANPDYWAKGVGGINAALQPAKIPTVIMEFGTFLNTTIQDFASNKAQIIAPPIAQFSQAYSAYHSAYSQYSFKDLIFNAGPPVCDYANGMNTQMYPTNITLLRQAIVHAVNYSQIEQQLYTFNGLTFGELFMPPVPPGWGPLDNPENISLYSYNITLAIQLANQAGIQNDFSLTLPNGTIIGNTSAPALSPILFGYILPLTPETQTTFNILSDGLSQIGVHLSVQSALSEGGTSLSQINGAAWCADWPDPIYQGFYYFATTVGQVPNGVDNATLTKLLEEIPFETNSTLQLQQTEQAYAIFTQLSAIIQMPNSETYFLKQPYVTGLVWSPFQFALLYNMISYAS